MRLGDVLFDAGRPEEGIKEYREAIRIAPDMAMLHMNFGSRLIEAGRLDEALAETREAVRLKPESVLNRSLLGLALQKKGRIDDAIAEYKECIRIDPNVIGVYLSLAEIYEEKGMAGEAKKLREEGERRKKEAEANPEKAMLGSMMRELKHYME